MQAVLLPSRTVRAKGVGRREGVSPIVAQSKDVSLNPHSLEKKGIVRLF